MKKRFRSIIHGMKMNKLKEELKKKSDLFSDLCKISRSVNENVFKQYDYGVTEHNIRHSYRIIEILDGLYFECFSKYFQLNYFEIFILLASAFLHDIGFFFRAVWEFKSFANGKILI